MARPRLPTQVLELRGSFRKQKGRRLKRAGEPEPVGELGDPPPHLDEAERELWRELAEHAPWLSGSDRPPGAQAAGPWAGGGGGASRRRMWRGGGGGWGGSWGSMPRGCGARTGRWWSRRCGSG